MRYAALIGVLCLIAGCGAGGDADVIFQGSTPHTQAAKTFEKDAEGEVVMDEEGQPKWIDDRHVIVRCPNPMCHKNIEVGIEYCDEQKKCGVHITWEKEYGCGWCNGTGKCQACFYMEQPEGKCYNCRGVGVVSFMGKSPPCKNCNDTGNCLMCKGDTNCDRCGGDGKLTHDDIKKYQKKELTD